MGYHRASKTSRDATSQICGGDCGRHRESVLVKRTLFQLSAQRMPPTDRSLLSSHFAWSIALYCSGTINLSGPTEKGPTRKGAGYIFRFCIRPLISKVQAARIRRNSSLPEGVNSQMNRPQFTSTVNQNTARNEAFRDLCRSVCWAISAPGQPPNSDSK